MNKQTVLFVITILLLSGMVHAAADAILIKNGTIVAVVGKTIVNGSVLIQNGKIAEVGAVIDAPANATIIDAKGMYVYPGMVAPLTAIGLTGYPGSDSDINEVGQSTPWIDPYEALNPEDETIDVTRIDGVTTALSAAGTAGIINGRAMALNLDGTLPRDMLLKRDVLLIFNMGARSKSGYPKTLPGILSFIREKLSKAKAAAAPKKKGKKNEAPGKDMEMEVLLKVVKREMPVMFMTSNEVTIRLALELIEEFNLKGILFANGDILKYAERLAEKNIPLIWAGTMKMPERWEAIDKYYRTAAVLAQKGVLFAFSESSRQGSRNVRRQPVPASLSVAFGLSEEDAVKALTINAAKILGIADQVGSLEKGKIANIFISTKPIIQLSARIRMVMINGRIIPLTSVQTMLYDKYKKIVQDRIKKE
ncbi:MAG: amidohydrolase family protein [Candidatus Aminicenantes bacterium]|nr:amidohydrolase family protein [Candidatus Aminicenantes bacterium]